MEGMEGMEGSWDCVGFVGIGNMGLAMVERLLGTKVASQVVVWNRSPSKAEQAGKLGAQVAKDLDELVIAVKDAYLKRGRASVHVMMTGDDAASAVIGQLLEKGLAKCIVVSHTTSSAEAASAMAQQCEQSDNSFVCAPVTGRPTAARSGQLVLWLSCNSGGLDAMKSMETSLFPAMAKSIHTISEAEADKAAVFKLITNFMLYASGEIFAETAVMLEKHNVKRTAVKDWVDALAPNSIFQQYADRIARRDYDAASGAGLDIAVKDLKIIKRLAGGCEVPALDATVDHMVSASEQAEENLDWCAIALEVERRSK